MNGTSIVCVCVCIYNTVGGLVLLWGIGSGSLRLMLSMRKDVKGALSGTEDALQRLASRDRTVCP